MHRENISVTVSGVKRAWQVRLLQGNTWVALLGHLCNIVLPRTSEADMRTLRKSHPDLTRFLALKSFGANGRRGYNSHVTQHIWHKHKSQNIFKSIKLLTKLNKVYLFQWQNRERLLAKQVGHQPTIVAKTKTKTKTKTSWSPANYCGMSSCKAF